MAGPRRRGRQAAPGFRELVDGDLRRKSYRPVYLLVGSDSYRIEGVVQHLREQAIGAAQAAFNVHVLQGAQTGIESALQVALSLPMLGGRQLVWVKDADRSLGTREAEDALLRYLEKPAGETILVMTADAADGRRRWVKACREAGYLFQLDPPAGQELVGWVVEAARRRRVPLDPELATTLVELVGDDLHALSAEIDKLSLLLEREAGASRERLGEVIVQQRLGDAFELIEAIRPGNAAPALAAWQRQSAWGRDAHEVCALLASRFRKMALVASLAAEGLAARDIAARLGMHPFYCGKLLEAARAIGEAGIGRSLAACRRCDAALKGSPLRPEAVLERALLEICADPLADRAAAN